VGLIVAIAIEILSPESKIITPDGVVPLFLV